MLMVLSFMGCTGGEECPEEDWFPPEEITTNENPYSLTRWSDDQEASRAFWKNRTTGASGDCLVYKDTYCWSFPYWCKLYLYYSANISLVVGNNNVTIITYSDNCGECNEYIITYSPSL